MVEDMVDDKVFQVFQKKLQEFMLQFGWVVYKDFDEERWFYHPDRKVSFVMIKDNEDVLSSSKSSDLETTFASPSVSIGSSSLVRSQYPVSANHITEFVLESRDALRQEKFGARPPPPPLPPSPSPLRDTRTVASEEKQLSSPGVQKVPLQNLSCREHKEISNERACVDDWIKDLEPEERIYPMIQSMGVVLFKDETKWSEWQQVMISAFRDGEVSVRFWSKKSKKKSLKVYMCSCKVCSATFFCAIDSETTEEKKQEMRSKLLKFFGV